MKTCICVVALLLLPGCMLAQDAYDDRAQDECRELPTPDERLACDRAVHDRALKR